MNFKLVRSKKKNLSALLVCVCERVRKEGSEQLMETAKLSLDYLLMST